MVNFTILLLLCLITESAGIPYGDIHVSSKLKLQSRQNHGSTFSKKLQSLKEKRLKLWILKNLLGPQIPKRLTAAKRDGFGPLCIFLGTKICSRICLTNLRCYIVCKTIREVCRI